MRVTEAIKKGVLRIKRWLCRCTESEVFAKETLSNDKNITEAGVTQEMGALLASSLMSHEAMKVALAVALERLGKKERPFFPKREQYRKSLFFLHKLSMQSEYTREILKLNYLSIMPFVFYEKGNSCVSASIRLLAGAILKTINTAPPQESSSYTTFITCA